MNVAAASHLYSPVAAERGKRVAHIDGLRAIAVLAVVGYHAGVPGFSGGFVGVDVFFVISGYLIINHLVGEMSAGSFSLVQFYARRSLRLFPPLIVVIVASTIAAAFILVSPYEWEWFGLSAFFSSIYLSNFYFLKKQGYFDIDSFQKPLLHTWSLSVEEQFYFVVPLLLMGCFAFAARRKISANRVLALACASVFIVSLIGCIVYTDPAEQNSAFYLMHWRAWEFAAGGAIGFLMNRSMAHERRHLASAIGVAGIGLILFAVFFFEDRHWFPGYIALLPVAGAVLVLSSGLLAPDALSARLIALKPIAFIGLISYSWYLWHWPMISLARMAQFGDPSLARDLVMAALAFLLSILTYRLVEQPARRFREQVDLVQAGQKLIAIGFFASLTLAIFSGGLSGVAYVWTSRNPAMSATTDHLVQASACPPTLCEKASGQRGTLIGDSHADRMEETLERETKRVGASIRRIQVSPGAQAPAANFSVAIYSWNSSRWKYRNAEERLAEYLSDDHRRVLLVGPVPEFRYEAANCWLRAERYGIDRDKCAVSRETVEERRLPATTELKRLAKKYSNVRYIDPLDLFCDSTMCRPHEKGILLHKDKGHISIPFGSDRFYYEFKEDFWWVMSGNSTK